MGRSQQKKQKTTKEKTFLSTRTRTQTTSTWSLTSGDNWRSWQGKVSVNGEIYTTVISMRDVLRSYNDDRGQQRIFTDNRNTVTVFTSGGEFIDQSWHHGLEDAISKVPTLVQQWLDMIDRGEELRAIQIEQQRENQ